MFPDKYLRYSFSGILVHMFTIVAVYVGGLNRQRLQDGDLPHPLT